MPEVWTKEWDSGQTVRINNQDLGRFQLEPGDLDHLKRFMDAGSKSDVVITVVSDINEVPPSEDYPNRTGLRVCGEGEEYACFNINAIYGGGKVELYIYINPGYEDRMIVQVVHPETGETIWFNFLDRKVTQYIVQQSMKAIIIFADVFDMSFLEECYYHFGGWSVYPSVPPDS